MRFGISKSRDGAHLAVWVTHLVFSNRQYFIGLVKEYADAGVRYLFVDFYRTHTVDSQGVGAMIYLSSLCKERGIQVVALRLHGDALSTFQELVKDGEFEIRPLKFRRS